MKKKINLILLASSFALLGTTACNPATDTAKSDDSSTVVDESASLAKSAWAGVATNYDSWASDGLTGDQTLTLEAKKTSTDGTKEYKYTIAYSVASDYSSNLKISEDGKKLLVTVPIGNDFQGKVHAKLSVSGSTAVVYEADFNVKVKAAKAVTIAQIYDKKAVSSGDYVAFNAIYIGTYPKQGAIFGAGEYAILAFKNTDTFETGKAYSIVGQVSDYSGLRELKNVTAKALDAVPEGLAAPTTLEMDSTNVRAFKFGDDNRPVKITGAKVTNTSISSSNNLTVTLDLNGVAITAFMNADYSADVIDSWYQRKGDDGTTKALVQAGDIVSFTGYVSAYNDKYQVVYGNVTDWKEPEVSATCPVSSLAVGNTATIAVKAKEEITSTTYSTSDATVATVDDKGVITGVKAGNVTITVTIVAGGVTYTKDVKIEIFAIDPTAKTVGEILKLDISGLENYKYDQEHIYSVTGILEGLSATDAYGNGYLTDDTTGETVGIYGLTGTKFGGISYANGKYSFSNPKDAKTTLTDVLGKKVTLNVMVEKAGSVPMISGYLVSAEANNAKYASTINTPTNGTASLSSTEDSVYGTEIKVTATPATGYKVDKVTVTTAYGTKTLEAGEDGTYAYAVTCKNEVNVTFKVDSKPASGSTVVDTWTCSDDKDNLPTATVDDVKSFNATFKTAEKIAMEGVQFKNYNGVVFFAKGKGFIYNTAPIPGTITSVKLTTASGASNNAKYAVTFGAAALKTISNSSAVNIGTGKTGSYTCSVTDAKYFQVAVDKSANGQVASIEITYTAD